MRCRCSNSIVRRALVLLLASLFLFGLGRTARATCGDYLSHDGQLQQTEPFRELGPSTGLPQNRRPQKPCSGMSCSSHHEPASPISVSVTSQISKHVYTSGVAAEELASDVMESVALCLAHPQAEIVPMEKPPRSCGTAVSSRCQPIRGHNLGFSVVAEARRHSSPPRPCWQRLAVRVWCMPAAV